MLGLILQEKSAIRLLRNWVGGFHIWWSDQVSSDSLLPLRASGEGPRGKVHLWHRPPVPQQAGHSCPALGCVSEGLAPHAFNSSVGGVYFDL